MKLKEVVHYLQRSPIKGLPLFILLMDDGKEYISVGDAFIENTKPNRDKIFPSTDDKASMLSYTDYDIGEIVDAGYMFCGCDSITEFDIDMPNVICTDGMFAGCSLLRSFESRMPNVISCSFMFDGCSALETFISNINNVRGARATFRGCNVYRRVAIQGYTVD